jgi:hypothetical protein
VKPAERVTLNPDPKLGPIIVQLLRDGDKHSAVALTRLAANATTCQVIERWPDHVVLRVPGSRRRFVIPADVVKSARKRAYVKT